MEHFHIFGFVVFLGISILSCEIFYENDSEIIFETFAAFFMVKFAGKNFQMTNLKIQCMNIYFFNIFSIFFNRFYDLYFIGTFRNRG